MTALDLNPAVRDERLGIMLMLVGMALFSLVNALVKELAQTFSINQIVAFRNVGALIPILLFALMHGGVRVLRPNRPRAQVAQAVLFGIGVWGSFFAYKLMPITDATAISFAQPLIVVALAAPMLGETVGWRRWLAVLAGFAGVMLMVAPSGQGFNVGALFAGAAAVASAAGLLQMRSLSRHDSSLTILFWTMALSGALAVLLSPFGWVTPSRTEFWVLTGMGVVCGILQYVVTLAVYHASVSAIAPTRYTMILWAVAIDVVWFGDWPTLQVLAGSAIVVFASWLVLQRPGPRAPAA
jgi:drug/metabolite transporter (DMT)-like permease